MRHLYGSPTLASSADGRLELFVFDTEQDLWHIWQQHVNESESWRGWCNQSGGWSDIDWPCVILHRSDETLEVIASGTQVFVDCQSAPSSGWTEWGTLPPVPTTVPGLGFYPPGAVSTPGGFLDLFVANGGLWFSEQFPPSTAWTDWGSLGSPDGALVVGPVGAGVSGDGRIEVFVVDENGQLCNVRQTSAGAGYSGWNAYGNPGVALADRPALAQSADGRLELFVRGVNGQLYHQWETAVGTFTWSGWSNFNGPLPDGIGMVDHPVVAAGADGRLELFVTGAHGQIYHAWQTAPSKGWSHPWQSTGSAGGGFATAAGLGRNADGRLELFAVGNDGNLYHMWQTAPNNGWSPWTLVPPQDTTVVPNVLGINLRGAEVEITAAGLVPSVQGAPSIIDSVSQQRPAHGTYVGKGTPVEIWLRPTAEHE